MDNVGNLVKLQKAFDERSQYSKDMIRQQMVDVNKLKFYQPDHTNVPLGETKGEVRRQTIKMQSECLSSASSYPVNLEIQAFGAFSKEDRQKRFSIMKHEHGQLLKQISEQLEI